MRKKYSSEQIFFAYISKSLLAMSCRQKNKKLPDDYEVTMASDLTTHYIVKTTPANSPTFYPRCLEHMGDTLFKSFITTYRDQEWKSFLPDRPFPAFSSEHIIKATAALLTNLHGENFAFTAGVHPGRKRDEIKKRDFKPRVLSSCWKVSEKIADLSFYGGIHTPQDNAPGVD